MLENIKLFATSTDRSTYEDSENYIEPYVSLVEGDNSVHYNKGGDTPSTKTQWKYVNGSYFMAGIINDNIAQCYGPYEGAATLFRNGGESDGTVQMDDTIKGDIKQAIQKTWKRNVDDVVWIKTPVSWGQKLPDWESYEKVTK